MAIQYGATGKIVPKRWTVAALERMSNAPTPIGACVACGKKKTGVEPDARKYECAGCGKNLLYGAEEIALMGWTK